MRHTTHASRWATAGLLTALTLGTTLDGPLLGAGEIRMAIDGGRVTLSATEAPLADVLAAWSRVGGTRFVGAETLGRETVTLRLVEADEADAIRLLLRAAAGYVAAPRRAGAAGAARYDRVTILAARRTPAPAPGNTAPAAVPCPASCRWRSCNGCSMPPPRPMAGLRLPMRRQIGSSPCS